MATAINFNWVVNDKMTDGKTYDFNFVDDVTGEASAVTVTKSGNYLTFTAGAGSARVEIFRAGMRVKDAVSIALKRAGRVTSGEVYKADILRSISSDYNETEIYTGIFNPSHEFNTNMPKKDAAYYIGFELETAGRNADCENALHRMRSNIWRQVSDASISGRGISGIEFVSTFIHPEDAVKPAFYEDFCEMLTGLAVSGSNASTGLHCHVSRTAFGATDAEQDENIAKLIYLENYILSDSALAKLYGRDASGQWARPNRGNSGIIEHVAALQPYARDIMNNTGIKNAVTTDLMRGNKTRCGHNYPAERYHRINITNRYTVEFRQGKGQIKSQALANIAQHVCTAAAYVCGTKWANLSAAGYYKSIPNSAKYGEIKRIFQPSTDND